MNGAALQRFAMVLLLFSGVVELKDTAAPGLSSTVMVVGLFIGLSGLAYELDPGSSAT